MSTAGGKKKAHPRSPAADAVFARLSCGLGRRDEKPNVEVGQDIAERRDEKTVAALVELLGDAAASSSAVKALYECGYWAPDLLTPHASAFFDLLGSRKNRLVWGGMIALWCIAGVNPDVIYPRRTEIMEAFENGTAITQETAMKALTAVAGSSLKRKRELSPWLLHALHQGRAKDLAGWLADALPHLTDEHAVKARKLAASRMREMKPSARKRVEKLLQ